MANAVTQFEME